MTAGVDESYRVLSVFRYRTLLDSLLQLNIDQIIIAKAYG